MSAPPTTNSIKADTGATGHFIDQPSTNLNLTKVAPITNPSIKVLLPNGDTMQSTHTTTLPINLPQSARTAHVFPSLASGSLLSVGKLCDEGCTAVFTKKKLEIHKNKNISIKTTKPALLTGSRDPPYQQLWNIQLSQPTPIQKKAIPTRATILAALPALNSVIHTPSIRNRVAFYHAAMFSPTVSTWTNAVRNNFLTTWPSLTVAQITKYAPNSIATIKGHQHALRSNIQSTKKQGPRALPLSYAAAAAAANVEEIRTIIDPPSLRTNDVFCATQEISGKTFSDQTGKFVCPSTSGNKYLFILYHYDSNTIHARAIPSRTKQQLLKAYKSIVHDLTIRGYKPRLHTLDNEISNEMKDYMDKEDIAYQLTPVGLHRRNLAERAIQTFKNHFIAGLCSTHPDFPLVLWDYLVPQALLTLNLLRKSRTNPQLSGYAQLYGTFNYLRTPLAPPGMKVIVHERPETRGSWSPHGIDGWYVGPAMNHYRCHRAWIPSTNSVRISDTVSWIPHNIQMPTSSATDIIVAAAKDLTQALHQTSSSPLLPPANTETRKALTTLTTLFSNRVPTIKNTLPIIDPHSTPPAPLPRVPTKHVPAYKPPRMPAPTSPRSTAVPRVPSPSSLTLPSTTAGYFNISTTNKKRRRKNKSKKTKSTKAPQSPPVTPSPPPPAPVTHQTPPPVGTRQSTRTTRNRNPDYINSTFVMAPLLPKRVRALIQQEVEKARTSAPHSVHCINAVLDADTGKLLEYRDLLKGPDKELWYNGCSKEFARLCNGRLKDNTKGTNTLFFIKPQDLPPGKKPTYLRICANYRPQKEDPYRIRFTVGGNLINYNGETYTPTADLTTAKLLLNSVISTEGAKFLCIDLSNFYLKSPFTSPDEYEYMWIPLWAIPEDIMKEYNIKELAQNGRVLTEIRTGMYGLPQAGRMAYTKLVNHLADDGYRPTGHTPGLFKHDTRPVTFNLVVDDFGVKFVGEENVAHLIATLKKHYDITIDRSGSLFCGIRLDWDYLKRTVRCSMPGYVQRARTRFSQFPLRRGKQHSPHKWNKPQYGKFVQYAEAIEANVKLTPAQKLLCQEIVGTFLYYARAVDNTMLVAIGSIATAMSTASWTDLNQRLHQFLDYAATHPDASIQYHASDMHLWIHTDASYLNEPKARSRGGGYFFLSDKPTLPILPTDVPPKTNAPVHVQSKVLDAVVSSAQESETGSGFVNAKIAVPLKTALTEMGHPQGPTPLQFDNLCATGIINDEVKQRRSKAMDMRYYWLKDRVAQKQFHAYWRRGDTNLADYFTKHFPASHHKSVRPTYVLNNLIMHNALHHWYHKRTSPARVC